MPDVTNNTIRNNVVTKYSYVCHCKVTEIIETAQRALWHINWDIKMNLYIREMTDNSALLMTDLGNVIATFGSVDDAIQECSDWIQSNDFISDHMECYFAD